MAVIAKIKVWLSHDGYRDPDDNLAMLVGGAQAKAVDQASGAVSVAGFVYGDTKDGGQYYMLHPTGTAPRAFGNDSRYGDTAGNRIGAGNYEFYTDYGKAAIRDLGFAQYDLLAADRSGQRAWNFDATARGQISAASAALADDIRQAIAAGNTAVVYSAGGGANVPAEAIGYLKNLGVRPTDIAAHFAVVQHGRSNWEAQYEAAARELTRDVTIAISNQNMARYSNGVTGPDLKHAIAKGVTLDGSAFGSAFDKALDVATGHRSYVGLKSGTTFKTTSDASDAGSHAFAVDLARVRAAWGDRLEAGDTLPSGDAWAHRIDGDDGARLRVIYNAFTAKQVAALLDGDKLPAAAAAVAVAAAASSPEPETGPDSGSDTGPDTGSGSAPFATGGPAVVQGGVTLYGFDADGDAAEVVRTGGRSGVAAAGDAHDIDFGPDGSEMLGIDFGAAVDAIVLRLAGLGTKDGAAEAARLVVYDADGDALDTWVIAANGANHLEIDGAARYATLEALDWLGGDVARSDPDFGFVSVDLV